VVLLVCNGGGGAPGPCWQGGAEGPSVLEALSWRAWCGGGPGDGWAEVSLSKRFQISESLAEKREVVGEARPPRRVSRISEFHRRCDESVLLKLHWDKGRSPIVCAA
jgi:hypothetical protein